MRRGGTPGRTESCVAQARRPVRTTPQPPQHLLHGAAPPEVCPRGHEQFRAFGESLQEPLFPFGLGRWDHSGIREHGSEQRAVAGVRTNHPKPPVQDPQLHRIESTPAREEELPCLVGGALPRRRHPQCGEQRLDRGVGAQPDLVAGHLHRHTVLRQRPDNRRDLVAPGSDEHRHVGPRHPAFEVGLPQQASHPGRVGVPAAEEADADRPAGASGDTAVTRRRLARDRQRQPSRHPGQGVGDSCGHPERLGQCDHLRSEEPDEFGSRPRVCPPEPEYGRVRVGESDHGQVVGCHRPHQSQLRGVHLGDLVQPDASEPPADLVGDLGVGHQHPRPVDQLRVVDDLLGVQHVQVLVEESAQRRPGGLPSLLAERNQLFGVHSELAGACERTPHLPGEPPGRVGPSQGLRPDPGACAGEQLPDPELLLGRGQQSGLTARVRHEPLDESAAEGVDGPDLRLDRRPAGQRGDPVSQPGGGLPVAREE